MNTVERGQIISSLIHCTRQGEAGLTTLPRLLKKVLQDEMWKNFVVESTEEKMKFSSFEEFVCHPLPQGMGGTLRAIRRLCADHTDVLGMIEAACDKTEGRPKTSEEKTLYNVQGNNESPKTDLAPTGNSSSAGIRKLQKHRPDLFEVVAKGDKSVNAALIEAGLRRPPPTPLETMQKAWNKASQEDKDEFLQWIESQ
jgi:hypothetical protein